MTGLQLVTLGITSVGLLNCLVFCVGYHIYSRGNWRRSEHGVFLMLSVGCLGSLFALIISTRLFGMWPGRPVVSLVLYSAYVAVSFWPTRLLWLSYRRKKPVLNGGNK